MQADFLPVVRLFSTQKSLLLLMLLIATSALASKKPHDWQTGKLTDMSQDSRISGMTNPGQGGVSTAIRDVEETYVIDGGSITYTVAERLKWRWSKEADLVVNRPIKFFVDGKKLIILDDNGKEHSTQILKRAAKD